MSFSERELPFERDDLGRSRSAGNIPERRFARGRGDADTRRSAIDVVRAVGALGVSRARPTAAPFGLRKQWMILQAGFLQQRFQRASAAPESQGVNWEHCDMWIDV